MGIRNHLREFVRPYDSIGWKVGDKATTTRELVYSGFTIPKGAEVIIDSVPEARHGADPYDMGCIAWGGQSGYQVCLSSETAAHQTNSNIPDVRKP